MILIKLNYLIIVARNTTPAIINGNHVLNGSASANSAFIDSIGSIAYKILKNKFSKNQN